MLRRLDLKSLCVAAGAFTLLTTSFSPAAHAILTLSLNDGGGPTIVTDADDGIVDGIAVFNDTLTNFTVNVSTALSKPFLVGAPTLIDLNSINGSNSAGTLTIEISDTEFTNPTGVLFSEIGGTTNGSITYETFVDPANGNPFDAIQLASKTFSTSNFSGGKQSSIDLAGGNPYSLGLRITIEHQGGLGQVTSFDSQIRIPEPGSLGLLGAGLLVAGLLLRRRKTG